MTWEKLRAASLAAVMLAALASTAHAADADTALAESLFREGKRLQALGKYAEACPKFAESQKVAPGLGTLLNLASCHAQEGKTASAWAEFNDAIAQAKRLGDTQRQALAEKNLQALEPRLTYLRLETADPSNSAELSIQFDESPLSAASLGVPIPVNPGEHQITASAPAKQPWSERFVAPKDPGTLTFTIPALRPLTAAPVPSTAPQPVTPAPYPAPLAPAAQPAPAPAPRQSTSRPLRTAGFVIGGIGLGSLAFGGLFYLTASSENDRARKLCTEGDGTRCASSADKDEHDGHLSTAKTARTLSYVGLGFGAAAVAAGIVMIVAAPARNREQAVIVPVIDRNSVGMSYAQSF